MERNENGFSGYNLTRGQRNCPGTGEMWGGNGNTNGNAGINARSGNGNTNNGRNGCNNGCNNGGNGNNGNNGGNGSVLGVGECLDGSHQLAMVYSPSQSWRMLYSPEAALMRGTLFEELDKPLEDCVNG